MRDWNLGVAEELDGGHHMTSLRMRLALAPGMFALLIGGSAWVVCVLTDGVRLFERDQSDCPAADVQPLSWHLVPRSPIWISNPYEALR